MLETLWIFIIEIIALSLSSCAICIIFLLLTIDFLLLLDDLRKYITAVGIIFYLILDNFKGNFFNLDWSMGSGWENSSVIITFGGLVFISSMLLVEVCQIIWSLFYTCPVLIFGYFIKHSAAVTLCTFSLSIYVFVQLGSSYNHCFIIPSVRGYIICSGPTLFFELDLLSCCPLMGSLKAIFCQVIFTFQ